MDGTAPVRRLVLLRHAKAEPPGTLPDEMRPLALVGRTQCRGVAELLLEAGAAPQHALVSTAVRTRQTWELVRAALGAEPSATHHDVLYGAGPREVLSLVREVSEDVSTLLVVGHEPTMSAAASLLAADGDDAALAQVRSGLPTGTAAVLEVDGPWSGLDVRTARLVAVLRPPR